MQQPDPTLSSAGRPPGAAEPATVHEPSARGGSALAARDNDPARRLLRGIAAATAEKGYAATTIADIVRHAHVSKRTFYEHFADKQACYLEAYRRGTGHLARAMLDAGTAATGPWRDRLHAALTAYLAVLVDVPASTHAFTVGIPAAGPEAVAVRRTMHQRTSEALIAVVDHVRRDVPALGPLSPIHAKAIIGGLSELIIDAVADERIAALPTLADPMTDLLAAVLTAPESPPTEAPR